MGMKIKQFFADMNNLGMQRTKKQAVVFYIFFTILIGIFSVLWIKLDPIIYSHPPQISDHVLRLGLILSGILAGSILRNRKWGELFFILLIMAFILIFPLLYHPLSFIGDTVSSALGFVAVMMIPVAYSTTLKPKELN